jgi:hypothetical protein
MNGMNSYNDMSWKCKVSTSLLKYGYLHDIISENHLIGFILTTYSCGSKLKCLGWPFVLYELSFTSM